MQHQFVCIGVLGVLAFCCIEPAYAQDWRQKPNYGSVSLKGGFTPDPYVKRLTAGGSIKTKTGGISAYVSVKPDLNLRYTKGNFKYIYIYAKSSTDITLLVNLPSTKYVANDDGGQAYKIGLRNPVIKLPARDGLYNIWVGVYGGAGKKTAPSTLYISEVLPK